jgi:pimeloyl-ACP methyl ester carboxylesterase
VQIAISKDGTRIAYDQAGDGPPLIMVAGAFSYRKYPGQVKLAECLSNNFTVINYDRRGRGDSEDTRPYAVEREIEDIDALIAAVGGSAYVWGLSSGALLALRAAAAGLNFTKLAVQEPPYFVDPDEFRPPADFVAKVTKLAAGGDRAAAVKYFMVDGMHAPRLVPGMLRLMPGVWRRLLAVAHTLPYDAALVGPFTGRQPLPDEWAAIKVPTMVMWGTESPEFLRAGSRAIAAALPGAKSVAKKGLGHTKALNAGRIAPELVRFFAPGSTRTSQSEPA